MAISFYKRSAVPPGAKIRLEVQFRDSAGIARDADSSPTITINDAANTSIVNTTIGVLRTGEGRYRYDLTIPDIVVDGTWRDTWTATIDGYANITTFDFNVLTPGTIEAVGSGVTKPEMQIGDDPIISFTQEETYGINMLMKLLRFRLRNTQIMPNGSRCDILSIADMQSFLWLALSEFNATPAFTGYFFSDVPIYTTFSDIIVEGAYLKALPSIIPAETGREWVATDDGINITPASVSSALSGILGQLYTEYRAKIKEAKRNHRPAPLGMGAGQLAVANPAYRKVRNIRVFGVF
jgi:hypothetical protein